MMTTGLVVTLEPDSPAAEGAALAAIAAEPSFMVGTGDGCRLPVALEAAGRAESERWHDWLCLLPGVAGVEVVFVHWDDVGGTHAGD